MNKDSFRNRRNGFQTMDGGQSGSPKPKAPSGKIIGIVAAIIVLAILLANSAYEIKEQEQAVLITLGSAQAVTDPGLHFKLPFIQQVRKVNTTIQGFSIGYNTGSDQTNEDESLMIT